MAPWAGRLARWAVRLVVVAGVAAVGSGLLALGWSPDLPDASVDICPDPPCFGLNLGGASLLSILPFIVHVVLLGVALLLGGLSLLLALVTVVRGRGRTMLFAAALAAAGPVLVLIGGEIVPHVMNPCVLPDLAGAEPPGFCARSSEGADVPDAWHALYHAAVGFLPLSLAFAWGWKRWTSQTGLIMSRGPAVHRAGRGGR